MTRKQRGRRIKNCEFCGNLIGAERGPAAKTCSPECQRERNAAKERARYERVKGTAGWKETRAVYLENLSEKADNDPELKSKLAESHRAAAARYDAKLNADPTRRALRLKYKRDERAAKATQLRRVRSNDSDARHDPF